jgi:protein-disulfide isomerase
MLDARILRPASPASKLFLGAVAAALVLAATLVAVSLVGSRDDGAPAVSSSATLRGSADTQALLRGIPQAGTVLGSADAPVTLVEYADLQCPYCAEWAARTLPVLVDDYVRAGKVRLVFRGLAFLGAESEVALRAALAAGEEGKLWNVLHLLYGNQGPENGGWVTDDLLAALGPSIPGLDVELMLGARDAPAVDHALRRAAAAADRADVRGTPAFELGPTGGRLERLEVTSLDAGAFTGPIDEQLRRS